MVFRQESASFSRAIFLLDNMVLDHLQVSLPLSETSFYCTLSLQASYEEALKNICREGADHDLGADSKNAIEDPSEEDCYSDNE